MLAGFAQEFFTRNVEAAILFDTHIKSQPARTLYDIKCVAALLIRPRKVTQVLDKSWPIGTYTEIKRDTRGRVAPEGEWFIAHTYRIWA